MQDARLSIVALPSAEDTWPLRHKILRPGQDLSAVQYPEDRHGAGTHWGAYLKGTALGGPQSNQKQLVGVASLFQQQIPVAVAALMGPEQASQYGWQLRGMAVDSHWQGHHIGSALLAQCFEFARARPVKGIWCNARTSALAYYRKNGFSVVGDEFTIAGAGPHWLMVSSLS